MTQAALDLDDDGNGDGDDGGVPTYSVGELAEAINGALRRRFDDGVWVRGEVQGWSERGPHAYFRLVEVADDGSKAVLNVQFFANHRARMRSMLLQHRLHLADGLKVRIFGQLDFFGPSGQLGLKMSGIDPRFTLGELALERDEVVRRLTAAGLLQRNRERVLSPAPLRVGVVTSRDSAAWADFEHEIERSGLSFQLRLIDVRVQGDTAVAEVSAAIRTLGRHDDLDVVVVIRGGGSRTDLATFDHETIALAIAHSRLPVLTGLGHEIDRSVADEVAHLSLKTPTACAAALVERVVEFRQRTEAVWIAIGHVAERGLTAAHTDVAEITASIHHRVAAAIDRSDDRLAQRAHRVVLGASRVVDRADMRIQQASGTVRRVTQHLVIRDRQLDTLSERLRLLDPSTTMARGWSITRSADGRIVRDITDLSVGDQLFTTLVNGTARSRVEDVTP
jgi:exodeoxyribonuclease VII large subunit